jgi:hypothetical protein
MFCVLETQIESNESSQTVANVDHATTNGAEVDGEAGADQGGESTNSLHSKHYSGRHT